MAVKVTNSNWDEIQHSVANDVEVKDGHLFVTQFVDSYTTNRIAVYAPGSWLKAVVDQAAQ